MTAFGDPVPFFAGDGEDGTTTTSAHEDMDLVRRTLLDFNEGGRGLLRIYRPRPTAVFAPRDTTLPRYRDAEAALDALGFAAVERRAGGSLAVYDSHALVIDLVAPHADPREHVIERFRLFSAAIAATLTQSGIDARVGGVAGEYCRGDYSINIEGRVKLVGVAQRIARRGFHLGAVMSVVRSDAARDAVAEAYRILGMDFEPATFGALSDWSASPDFAALRQTLAGAILGPLVAQG
jgi:lipoate-protein ligase A